MFDIGVLVQQVEGAAPLIPVWFYLFSSLAYGLAALISLFVSYFSFKLYKTSNIKSHRNLSLVFASLFVAYSILTFTSMYTYFYHPYLRNVYIPLLSKYLSLGEVNTTGYGLFYLASLTAYALLFLMHLPEKKRILPVLFVPIWYVDLNEFHAIAIILLGYVAIKTFANFLKVRSLNSFLVFFSFLMLTSFHLFLILISFNALWYLAAHSFLLIGFSSLLFTLIRVNRSGRKKK